MGLALDRKVLLTSKSERAKTLDFHPSEPWIAVGLYNGAVNITNYQTQSTVKSIQASSVPVRCVKFIPRRNWIAIGSDDFCLRIFNYNTLEKVHSLDAHSDYIRSIAVHPHKSLVLTSSDDTTVKLWDWDAGWKCVCTYEGHQHYVMQVVFNPKDPNTFATASLDRTIKIWSLGSTHHSYTLEGHEKGVNGVSFYQGGDRPFLASASDDQTVRVWDYQSKACVRVMTGHTQNVSSLSFHPRLPFLMSAGEDGTVRVWGTSSFRAELVINVGLDRLWAVAVSDQQGEIGIAGDLGSSVMLLGRGEPVICMDPINGKIVWAQQSSISTCKFEGNYSDCKLERGINGAKDLGQSDFIPSHISFSPNGRFISVQGDGEYTVYTSVAWRNRAFGKGSEFVWAAAAVGNNVYAVRDSPNKVTIFEDFSEIGSIKSADNNIPMDRIFGGGPLLTVCGGGYVVFYDYRTGQYVEAVELDAHSVVWTFDGDGDCWNVALLGLPKGLHILSYTPSTNAFRQLANLSESERMRGVMWTTGQTLVYSASDSGKIGYYLVGNGDSNDHNGSNSTTNNDINADVRNQLISIAAAESSLYPLGFFDNRVFFVDKDLHIRSWPLSMQLLRYQLAVLSGGDDSNLADQIAAITSDEETSNRLGKFLESLGQYETAAKIATDPSLRFNLLIKLGRLEEAKEAISESTSNQQLKQKWRTVGGAALADWKVKLAMDCMEKAGDLGSLCLVAGICSSQDHLDRIAGTSCNATASSANILFTANYLLRRFDVCYQVLVDSGRFVEAAMFAQSHTLSKDACASAVSGWRQSLAKDNRQLLADRLADPLSHPQLFPDTAKFSKRKSSIKSTTSHMSSSDQAPQLQQDDALSLEVNTTGTGSIRTDDVDEAIAAAAAAAGICPKPTSAMAYDYLPTHLESSCEFDTAAIGNGNGNTEDSYGLSQSFEKLDVTDNAYAVGNSLQDAASTTESSTVMKDAISSDAIPDEDELEDGWS